MTLLIAIFVVLFGLAFGSFLNVCVSRLPEHESIVRPASRCPSCGTAIRVSDNVPLVSWTVLRGQCRACRWPIPWRYPAVEFGTAALFLLCFLRFGLSVQGVGMAALCFLLLGLAAMDAETMRLPDAFTLPGIALGVVYAAVLPGGVGVDWRGALASVLSAAVAALAILVIRWAYLAARGAEGMGVGDVKLFAMIAAWLGWRLSLLTLVLGVLAAAAAGVAMLRRSRKPAREARLPFGSFLCAAAIYAIFAGQPIVDWYAGFFR